MKLFAAFSFMYIFLFTAISFGQSTRAIEANSVRGRQMSSRSHSITRTIYQKGPRRIIYPALSDNEKSRLVDKSIEAAKRIGIEYDEGKMLFPRTGMRVDDVMLVLGTPSSENEISDFDSEGNADFAKVMFWKSSKYKVRVVSRNDYVVDVDYPAFGSDLAKKGIALRDEISIIWNNIATDAKTKEAQKKKEQREQYLASLFAETSKNRKWSQSNGSSLEGMIFGIDGDFILLKKPNENDTDKPIRIAAFRLTKTDRDIVLSFCNENKIDIPELDPVTRIKKDMAISTATSILGKPISTRSAHGGQEYSWKIDEDTLAVIDFFKGKARHLIIFDSSKTQKNDPPPGTDVRGIPKNIF